MIETRPQKAVGRGADPGNPEACHISATAVSARGYNLAAVRSCRSLQLATYK
ncbi:MAG TPA: hypothetical protein VH254_06745 [Candidatus Udaeobacter sp.]|jgi:hypothetical protein|nr:hypothetical protein [Candidatus Udaeobacter sp.]